MSLRSCVALARCIFLVAALLSVASGCHPPVAPENEQAIVAIEGLGGSVVRNDNIPGRPVTSVEFPKATDAALKEVAGLKRLNSLKLAGTEVTDAGLKDLASLERLASLDLTDTKVTDAGLRELAAIKNLTRLIITGTATTDSGVADLQKALPYCHIQR